MNREIKFRVWDIVNKRMLSYGDIMTLPMWEVFPGTPEQRAYEVMQYTGLEDKNGNEIYEGDILKERTPSGFNYSVVKFGEIDISSFSCESKMCTCFYHDFSNFNDNWGEVALGNNLKNIEVIGNIYENPELLETKL